MAINQHYRNITDEQAKKCASMGGVVGVHCYGPIMYNGKDFPTIETFMDCIDYYVNLIGVDHVGIGLDSDATMGGYDRGTLINIHKRYMGPDIESSMQYNGYLAGRGYLSVRLEGLMNLANFPNITHHLIRRGYNEEDIQKILGENWLRIFRETW
jgi:membrane dipeptidase